jgi:hypothetical protein
MAKAPGILNVHTYLLPWVSIASLMFNLSFGRAGRGLHHGLVPERTPAQGLATPPDGTVLRGYILSYEHHIIACLQTCARHLGVMVCSNRRLSSNSA